MNLNCNIVGVMEAKNRVISCLVDKNTGSLMSPFVSRIEYDEYYNIFRLYDKLIIDEDLVVNIYFNMDDFGNVIGFVYNDYLDNLDPIDRNDLSIIDSYNLYKNTLVGIIRNHRNNRVNRLKKENDLNIKVKGMM